MIKSTQMTPHSRLTTHPHTTVMDSCLCDSSTYFSEVWTIEFWQREPGRSSMHVKDTEGCSRILWLPRFVSVCEKDARTGGDS